jgi:hypothetical protein
MGGAQEEAQWSEGARDADGWCPDGSRDPHGDAGGKVVSAAADACEHIAQHQPKFMLLYQMKPSAASDTKAGQDTQGNTIGDQDALVKQGEAKCCI